MTEEHTQDAIYFNMLRVFDIDALQHTVSSFLEKSAQDILRTPYTCFLGDDTFDEREELREDKLYGENNS